MPGPGYLKIPEGALLLPLILLPPVYLSVLMALRCYPEVSFGTENRIESVISMFVP